MENKIKAAFDGVHMGDACAARIEEALRMPAAAKEYCAQPAQPAKPRWTRVAAAAAVLVVLCCILMPVAKQTKEAARQNWLDLCRTALAEVQGRDSVHITAVTAAEGFPGETGAENRYWQQGNMWLRIGEMNFENSNEDYVVGNLWTPIGKYRFGFAGDYDPVVRPNWSVAGEDRQWEPYWIMDFDLDTAAILSVEGSSDSQGSAVTITYSGNPRVDSDTAYNSCTQTWYLDPNGKLVRLTEEIAFDLVREDAVYSVTCRTETEILSTPVSEVQAFLKKNLAEAQNSLQAGTENTANALEPRYAAVVEEIRDGLVYTEGNITYTYRGWTGEAIHSEVEYDTTLHTPWTEVVDGRVLFTANGETTDITGMFSRGDAFICMYTDSHHITHYIAIGGTVENPGFLEFTKFSWETAMHEGNLGGFGVNTWNSETDARYGWVTQAKGIFWTYGVFVPATADGL